MGRGGEEEEGGGRGEYKRRGEQAITSEAPPRSEGAGLGLHNKAISEETWAEVEKSFVAACPDC